MSASALIHTVLKSAVANVYPDQAPTGTDAPYVVYEHVGGRGPVVFMDGTVADKANSMVRVTVWCTSRLDAEATMARVIQAMTASSDFQARPTGAPTSSIETPGAQDLRSSSVVFSIWSTTS
jgi:hypothetical protein